MAMGWFSGAHMVWTWIGWLAILVAIVSLAVWAARSGVSSAQPERDDSPEEILKRRYARGELDREEYQRRLDDLRR